MAGSSTKISFRQLTEKHDCDHAASGTIGIILLYGFAQLFGYIWRHARHASKRTDSAQLRLTSQL